MKTVITFGWIALALSLASSAEAHPEFQTFVQNNSGRTVNCSMCHSHPDGPEGVKPGQIGSLSAEALIRLGQARAAFEPGVPVDSPILNAFGNRIVTALGKNKVLELKTHPAALGELLGAESDLDHDGISDADEYLQGTHPLEHQHGDPWALFVHNFKAQFFHVVMLAIATVVGLYGLNHLLRWFAGVTDRWADREDEVEV